MGLPSCLESASSDGNSDALNLEKCDLRLLVSSVLLYLEKCVRRLLDSGVWEERALKIILSSFSSRRDNETPALGRFPVGVLGVA